MKKLILILFLFTVSNVYVQVKPFSHLTDPVYNTSPPKIKVIKSGNYVYIRSYYNSNKDITIRMAISNSNYITAYDYVMLINKSNINTVTGFMTGDTIHKPTDDVCPLRTDNGGYIGAGHGHLCPIMIKPNHGKTADDLGSIWSDGVHEFYLTKILDNDRLIFINKVTGGEGEWFAYYTLYNDSVYHISGATNTETLVNYTDEIFQIKPVTDNISLSYLVDGTTPIIDDSVYFCDYFSILDSHDIIDPSTVTIWANGGDLWFNNVIEYRFQNYGTCIIDHKLSIFRKMDLDYMGFIQSARLNQSVYEKIWGYMPKTLPFGKYDLRKIIEFPSTFDTNLQFVKIYQLDTTSPPDRLIEFLGDNDTTLRVGYIHGYNSYYYDGLNRDTLSWESCWQIYYSAKSYPKAICSRYLDSGEVYRIVAFRQYFDPQLNPQLINVNYYLYDSSYYLYVDGRKNLTVNLFLPTFLINKSVTILDTMGCVVNDSVVRKNGLNITFSPDTNGYGYGILKLDN